MLILYVAILIAGLYWVAKILGPEMLRPMQSKTPPQSAETIDFSESDGPDIKIKKLETFLAEKNKNIVLLELELKFYRAQANSFDKIKTVLSEEIERLREQNRIFRSELGLPAVQSKENSIT